MFFVTQLLRSYMTSAALRARLCDWALVRATGVAYLYLVCCCDFTLLFIAVSNNTIYIIESVCYVRQWSCDNCNYGLRILYCIVLKFYYSFIHSIWLAYISIHVFQRFYFSKLYILRFLLHGPWPYSKLY